MTSHKFRVPTSQGKRGKPAFPPQQGKSLGIVGNITNQGKVQENGIVAQGNVQENNFCST